MHPIAPIGIQADAYHHALDRLEAIARTFEPNAPDMLRTAIIEILGEDLNLWPEDCLREQEAIPSRMAA